MLSRQDLIDDAEACKQKMNNAKALIGGLGGEKIRWTEASRRFQQVGKAFFLLYLKRCKLVEKDGTELFFFKLGNNKAGWRCFALLWISFVFWSIQARVSNFTY